MNDKYNNYDRIVFSIYSNIFKDINIDNNRYKFIFLNIERNYYELAKQYYDNIDVKMEQNIIEICVLFEYIYLNQITFFKIYKNETNNECLDLLFFLNLNIKLTKIINEKLKNLDCSNYVIDILNTTKVTDYINRTTYDLNKIKKCLINIFLKIISK